MHSQKLILIQLTCCTCLTPYIKMSAIEIYFVGTNPYTKYLNKIIIYVQKYWFGKSIISIKFIDKSKMGM